MKKDMYDILDNYQFEYFIKDNYIDIWRNGENLQINKDIDDLSMLEIILDDFCISSPILTKAAKREFPMYFRTPEKGEYIAVKYLSDDSIDFYSIKKFKEFRGDKIVCTSKSGKELYFDFYQIIVGDSHPNTTFWFNSHQNRVFWYVIEKMFSELQN